MHACITHWCNTFACVHALVQQSRRTTHLRTAARPAVIMRGRLWKSAGAGEWFIATRSTPAQSLGVGLCRVHRAGHVPAALARPAVALNGSPCVSSPHHTDVIERGQGEAVKITKARGQVEDDQRCSPPGCLHLRARYTSPLRVAPSKLPAETKWSRAISKFRPAQSRRGVLVSRLTERAAGTEIVS